MALITDLISRSIVASKQRASTTAVIVIGKAPARTRFFYIRGDIVHVRDKRGHASIGRRNFYNVGFGESCTILVYNERKVDTRSESRDGGINSPVQLYVLPLLAPSVPHAQSIMVRKRFSIASYWPV